MNLSEILGFQFDSLEEAKELLMPNQLVVTENRETFYIVNQETFIQTISKFNYMSI